MYYSRTKFWNTSDEAIQDMKRSKKIFAAFALVFFIVMAYFAYDISTRTTFPGAQPAKADVDTRPSAADSLKSDSSR